MLTRRAPDVIQTARLRLRRPRGSDALAVFHRYASDPDVTHFMSFRRHQLLADSTMFIDFSNVEWASTGCGAYLVFPRESDTLLGATGLSLQGDDAETGYVFARDAWGFGYATEALQAMIDVGRAMGLHALHAHCHPDHRASMHVLEKCGFTLDYRARASHVFPNQSPVKQDVLSYVFTFEPRTPPVPHG